MKTARSGLCHRLETIRQRISDAAGRAGRGVDDIHLLAVSKRHPAEAVAELAACGQRLFAESYVQEAIDKRHRLADVVEGASLEWHFIGPIQSNKTRLIAENFDWVHSLDRVKIAERLDAQRPTELPPLNVFLQVNIDDEPTKSGVTVADLPGLIDRCRDLPHLNPVGLMCIPERGSVDAFKRLAELKAGLSPELPYLSMGMSEDFEAAIEAGSTHVRVGSALFGPRD